MANDRRGPIGMASDEIDDLATSRPIGSLCVLASDGRLRAVPVRLDLYTAELASFSLPTSDFAADTDAACLVVDSFESYEGIRGLIVRGSVRAADGVGSITTRKVTGFSFAGALTPTSASDGTAASQENGSDAG